MDDLDKAILILYDPSSSPSLRSAASSFCSAAQSAPDPSPLIRFALDRIPRSPHLPVLFWSLQALHDLISQRYPAIGSADLLPTLRNALVSSPLPPDSPPYIKNKLSQTIVALIRIEYPSQWPDPFLRLIPPAGSDSSLVEMFARILAGLNNDLLSLDYPRSAEEAAAATRVKDAMRVQCISQIVRHWYDAVVGYRGTNPGVAVMVLETMQSYVSWIDISLVANNAFVPLLFDLIMSNGSNEQLRTAAAGCVLAIVLKRMDYRAKLALLRSLQLNRVFSDSELVLKCAPLVTGYADEALECYKSLGSDSADGLSSMDLLEEALPSVLFVMRESDELELGDAISFLSDYVSTIKSPSQKQLMYLGQILEVIRLQICYDPAYRDHIEALDKIGKEEEDEMAERRKVLLALFRGVCRVAPDVTQMFIRSQLVSALSSQEASVEVVESMLTLFYKLMENVSEAALRSGDGLLGELISTLVSARFACHSHRVVALVYLETITRCVKFVHDNPQYIPHVLTAFLDERGIHHSNLNVSRRASYLFMRTVKTLKAKFVPYLDMILQSLEDIVSQFTTSSSKDLKYSSSEDGSQTFEAIGLLIGMEEVSPEKQSEYLVSLLKPLCQQLESLLVHARDHVIEESSSEVSTLQQIVMALIAVSKGFNERLVTTGRPTIGIMFKQTLEIILQFLILFPNIKSSRNKIISFIHRMVEILGVSILPCLPMVLKQLLAESEPKDMMEFLVLINQLICKFNASVKDMIEEIFPAIANRLFVILSGDLPSGIGSNSEEVRELQELHRLMYTFLHVIVTHDLSSVFLAPNSSAFLEGIMQLVLLSSCSHKDITLRKLCVQIFIKLIKDWCSNGNGEDKVPGFRSFIVNKFAVDCCLRSVLDKSFDFRDANTLVLFGEIVLAQKVMYESFGNDFIIQFVSKELPEAHCPQNVAEQYYQKLQANDIKALRLFYQSLVENLRQQQNGSLVFR